MKDRMHHNKRGHIAYTEDELMLGIEMMEKLSKITDMLLYFLDRRNIKFTYMLMQVDDEKFEPFLGEQKRATDILVPINKERGIYAIVCQETDVEGGYHFAQRIIRLLEVDREKKCLSCNVLTVSTTHYDTQRIILRLLERYLDYKQKNAEASPCKIDFFALS
jgi:hypothetical protein